MRKTFLGALGLGILSSVLAWGAGESMKAVVFESKMLKAITRQSLKGKKDTAAQVRATAEVKGDQVEVRGFLGNPTHHSTTVVLQNTHYSEKNPFFAALQSSNEIRYLKFDENPPSVEERFFELEVPAQTEFEFRESIPLSNYQWKGEPEGQVHWYFGMPLRQAPKTLVTVRLPKH